MILRLGLLGCGRIAQFFHGPILAAQPGAVLTALADPVRENRRRLSYAAPGANHYADWRVPIDLGEVDAVVICLPPALHAPAAIAAFEAGCHVYVEKPLAPSLGEGEAMVAAWGRAGTVGMMGLNFRFHPLVLDARRRVASGELGRLVAIRTLFTSARRALPDWKAIPGGGGDALSDLATHDVDLATFIAGSPVDVQSVEATQQTGPEGAFAMAFGRLADGTVINLTAGQTTGASARRIDILGERGHLTIDLSEARPRPVEVEQPSRLERVARRLGALSPAELLHRPGREPSFAAALSEFVAAARTGRAVSPDLGDGLRAMEVVVAAQAAPEPVVPERAA